MTRDEQIKAFIAQKGVTRCPSADGNATPLRKMRRDQEREICGDGVTDDEPSFEQRAERSREAFGRARAAGFSISDALDEARDA